MTDRFAFIGDVHGQEPALRAALALATQHESIERVVMLGDYINKGFDSKGVLDLLIAKSTEIPLAALLGNHDAGMLDVLRGGDLAPFLKLGGAATIRSYLNVPVGADVAQRFRDAVPEEHKLFLENASSEFASEEVVATHAPGDRNDEAFRVSGHVFVGPLPRMKTRDAQIDTGCGMPGGRLTVLYWPSMRYEQVDAGGATVR